jgi:Tol biopolymer transport system component
MSMRFNPRGDRLAVSRFPTSEDPQVAPGTLVYDARSGRKEREIALREVDQVLNPTWAPDGHAIAFSGLSQGLSDLYVYDLRASSLQRLTNDAFAEVHPAWSPDSRTIAFATDRFTTNLDTLAIGRYELATIEPASGRVQRVRTFAGADSINPQWSRDGRDIYFVGNPSGIPDVYGVSMATGALTQVVGLVTEAQQADAIIRNGSADLVAIAREALHNPFWAAHASEALGVSQFVAWPTQYAWWLRARDLHVGKSS